VAGPATHAAKVDKEPERRLQFNPPKTGLHRDYSRDWLNVEEQLKSTSANGTGNAIVTSSDCPDASSKPAQESCDRNASTNDDFVRIERLVNGETGELDINDF